jgi:uncharacterized protein DUF2877
VRASPAASVAEGTPVGSALHLPVTLVGVAARRALSAELGWRVFAVFNRSFYCQSTGRALVLVGRETLGAGPLHVLWRGSAGTGRQVPIPEVGMHVGVDIDGARLDEGAPLMLGLRSAREWRPPVSPRWERQPLRRSLAWLECAAVRAPAEGVGRVIAPLARSWANPTGSGGESNLARLAWPAVAALSGWVRDAIARSRGVVTPPAVVERLVGLGPGLTPSGDDVLAGALLALHALSRADLADHLAGWLWPRIARRTGCVSLAHLECAARGMGAAVLHDALTALSTGDLEALDAVATALDTVGHSSGWDGLTGMVTVVAAWLVAADDDGSRGTPCR